MLKKIFFVLYFSLTILSKDSIPNELFLPKQLRKDIINNKYLIINFGLDNKKLLYSSKINLEYDFLENIIILKNDIQCNAHNNCKKSSIKKGPDKIPIEGDYYYYNANSFLGLTQQITQTINYSEKEFFTNCPIRILSKESDFQKNILGMGPNSPIWKHWNDLYNFYDNTIYFSFVFNPDFKNVFFWNLKIIKQDTYIMVDKLNSYYSFKTIGGLFYKNDITYNEYHFCLRMQTNKLFSLKTEIFYELKSYLCKNIDNCFKKNDLVELKGYSWNFKYYDFKNPTKENSFYYFLTDFFDFDENDNIIWFFEEQNISKYEKCDIFLEKRFFETHYFSIVNDLENPFYSLLSINIFNPNSFNEKSSFVFVAIYSNIFIIVIVFVFMLISFIYIGRNVENFKKNKFENKIRKRQISEDIRRKGKFMTDN